MYSQRILLYPVLRALIRSYAGSTKLAEEIKIIPAISLNPKGSFAKSAAVIEPNIISVIISKLASPGLTNFGPHKDANAPGITNKAINGKSHRSIDCVCEIVGGL